MRGLLDAAQATPPQATPHVDARGTARDPWAHARDRRGRTGVADTVNLPQSVQCAKTRTGALDASVIHLLEQERIVSFVERLRNREGIVPPESQRDLKRNLRQYPPAKFIASARVRVERVLLSDRELCSVPAATDAPTLEPLPDMAQEAAQALGELFLQASGLAALVPELAGVVARYAVAGLLEVPKLSVSMAGGVYTDYTGGQPMVVAMATAATDLDDIVRLFREQWRAEFLPGQRDRAPDSLSLGLWLRHCRRVLERDGDDEGTSYRRLAELSFDIWPKTRPRGETLDGHYERALEARAEQVRKSMEAVDRWKETIFGPPDTSPGQPPET